MLRITELARITGASVDEIHYLEIKGFIKPTMIKPKRRRVRQYHNRDERKVQLIIKYRRQGFTWDMAFKKALQELDKPSLFDNG
ncbi:MerR family transcriptional regulator [Chloroflexota bacterium]